MKAFELTRRVRSLLACGFLAAIASFASPQTSFAQARGAVAQNTVSFNVATNATIKVNYDVQIVDPFGEFTPGANHSYRATLTGDYMVCASIGGLGAGAGQLALYAFRNGAINQLLDFNANGPFGTTLLNGCAVVHTTSVNSTIDVRVTNAGAPIALGGTAIPGAGHFSITKVR